MDEAARRPHDLLYTDLIVTIIITKGCNYGSLKKWLVQNQLIPGAQAYTTVSNELVHIISTGTFPPASKQKQKKGKKKGDKETVEAIIEVCKESSPADTLPIEYEPTDSVEQDSEDSNLLDAADSSNCEESDSSSKSEASNEAPDAQSTM